MISFEISQEIQQQLQLVESIALKKIRPLARYYDDHEHEFPWDYAHYMWQVFSKNERGSYSGTADQGGKPFEAAVTQIHMVEMISWGDAGIYLCTPGTGLGGAAVEAAGTEEQKERFLKNYFQGKSKWTGIALTEAHCGSDPSTMRTSAVRQGDCWVLNGEKIFVTRAQRSMVDSQGFIVVWATIDPSAGRAGIRPFVVEANTPGFKITKLEHKLGIRASDTASVILEDCRIPLSNLLGNPDVGGHQKGFKGAMATFDSTRPTIAASALGVGRAAVDLVKELLALQGISIRYQVPRNQLSAIERDIIDMEAQLRAAWLLTLKAAWLADQQKPCTIEASMCKVKAGEVVTKITQKAVELMGPLGYSRQLLLEKWMRDAKVNDLFEGTGQINRLIIARRILGYSSKELR